MPGKQQQHLKSNTVIIKSITIIKLNHIIDFKFLKKDF